MRDVDTFEVEPSYSIFNQRNKNENKSRFWPLETNSHSHCHSQTSMQLLNDADETERCYMGVISTLQTEANNSNTIH